MGVTSNKWIKPSRPRDTFPPYQLADRDVVRATEAKTRKLARIYHVGHDQAWNGREVLRELVDKHGGIRVPDGKRDALGKVASMLLWGELAAWSISADIALKLDDTDAKMAASSQVFDEARHFYVLRDYLWQAGVDVPALGGYSRKLLVDLLETDNLLHKLVGMQLMVENTAVALFKMLAAADVEPVLTDLMYYYERDEARHVGLGVLALPAILADLSRRDTAALYLFQSRLYALMIATGLTMREPFEALGVDQSELQRYGFRLQKQVFGQMRETTDGAESSKRTNGLVRIRQEGQDWLNQFLFPNKPATELHPLHLPTLRTLVRVANAGDRWLA